MLNRTCYSLTHPTVGPAAGSVAGKAPVYSAEEKAQAKLRAAKPCLKRSYKNNRVRLMVVVASGATRGSLEGFSSIFCLLHKSSSKNKYNSETTSFTKKSKRQILSTAVNQHFSVVF